MAAPSIGTCAPWATEADLCEPCNDYESELAAQLPDTLQMASDVLYQLSGSKYPGLCTDVVRPCAKPGPDIFNRGDPLLLLRHMPGTWYPAWGTCGCWAGGSCGLGGNREVLLPSRPVNAITKVLLDGVELTADVHYRLDDYKALVRLPDANGRPQHWPCCQRMDLASTEVGTWEVWYTYGLEPPPLGVRAAAVLACELAMACSPSVSADKCRLPRRVQTVIRQGVTIVMAPSDFLDPRTGKTGIWEVDLFLFGDKAAEATAGSTVFSPDTYRRVRRTNT